MNIYERKTIWKWLLLLFGALIVLLSFLYTNAIVRRIAADERQKVEIWAETIQQKTNLVNYTNRFFKKMQQEERKRVQLWADATKRLIYASNNEDITFYSDIISGNTTIPVILTDKNNKILAVKNLDFSTDTIKELNGILLEEFSVYEPIIVDYGFDVNYLYYKDSQLFTELREVFDNLVESFFTEVAINSSSVPVIITDSTQKNIIEYGNIDSIKAESKEYMLNMLISMKNQNNFIKIEIENKGTNYIYYKDSYLLTQLQYYPVFQLIIIGIFILIAYFLFSTARRYEQNQVWVGMSKETAHQLGTPISSIIAWLELIKMQKLENKYTDEIIKDVSKLEKIIERFSKIGSAPKLENTDIVKTMQETITYIKARTSKKIVYEFSNINDSEILVPLNKYLFEWVIENLLKNAIDTMGGVGKIKINIIEEAQRVIVDIEDTGKGLPKSKFKTVFNPGFTTKKRGWGLGLTLTERIIENYHKGKIFVKSSVINKGTIFRIIFKK